MLTIKGLYKGVYDPFELNSIFLDTRSTFESLLPNTYQKGSFFSSIFDPIKYLFVNLIIEIIRTPKEYRFALPNRYRDWFDNTLIFLSVSKNNQNALSLIIKDVASKKDNIKIVNTGVGYHYFPVFWILIVSTLYLPFFWNRLFKLPKSKRRIVLFNIRQYMMAPGTIWFLKRIMLKNKPECIVLSNDHLFLTKGIELVCEEYGIKTIYVQHASVSYAFPELHFSYSFLDGMDSYEKYVYGDRKTHGSIFLLGAVRYDMLSTYRIQRKNNLRNCIGIAVNELDDNCLVNKVCNELIERNPQIKVKIRTHPRIKNNPFMFDNKERIMVVCATDESITDYLDSIDIQISGDSGVHFDAIIGGVKTIAYNMSTTEYSDNYGYIKSGLVKYANTIDELMSLCYGYKFEPVGASLVRYYDESYGKEYAGHCSSIISDFVLNNYDIDYISKRYNMEVFGNNGKQYFKIVS